MPNRYVFPVAGSMWPTRMYWSRRRSTGTSRRGLKAATAQRARTGAAAVRRDFEETGLMLANRWGGALSSFGH
jgi:hypothetical protein